jgi:hypothetical protein
MQPVTILDLLYVTGIVGGDLHFPVGAIRQFEVDGTDNSACPE